jgi:GTPase
LYTQKKEKRERAIIVGVARRGQSRLEVDDYLDELELLADTAGADIVERIVQERHKLDPAFMIGRGKVKELALAAKYLDADLIIFDDDLTPAQAKNIEDACNIKIIDRSGLILDIFAKHARTREARIQVELAQLQYLASRLTRIWTHLSRQVGGIGVRGPGETQLEVDRRLIRKRIGLLESSLEKIAKQRNNRRKNRNEMFKVALVGYTNVGKSTILNTLTEAKVLVENQLFATLDSTVKILEFSDHQKILLIDTVGFIRKLPHHLVASFKSTLEEVVDADLLLHVADITSPFFEEQMKTVIEVLRDLNIDDKPVIKVFNKIDKLEDPSLMASIKEREDPAVFISAHKGIFIEELTSTIQSTLEKMSKNLRIQFPVTESAILSRLHSLADIYSTVYEDTTGIIELKTNAINAAKIHRMVQQNNCIVTEI